MPTSHLRIALADDNQVLRFCIKELLEPMGAEFTEAETGPGLLDLLDGGQFDVVITDVGMPGASGVDVARTRRGCGDHTPFVIVTGAPDRWEDVLGAVERVVLLAKPFTEDELRGAIQRALDTTCRCGCDGRRCRPATPRPA